MFGCSVPLLEQGEVERMEQTSGPQRSRKHEKARMATKHSKNEERNCCQYVRINYSGKNSDNMATVGGGGVPLCLLPSLGHSPGWLCISFKNGFLCHIFPGPG